LLAFGLFNGHEFGQDRRGRQHASQARR
jgi:hypothetical protein